MRKIVVAPLLALILTVPAATVRRFEPTLRTQQLATFALTAVEGLAAIWIGDAFNVGPGPALAVLGALVYAAAALVPQGVRPLYRRAAA